MIWLPCAMAKVSTLCMELIINENLHKNCVCYHLCQEVFLGIMPYERPFRRSEYKRQSNGRE